ncbi:hypothetical protein F4780DRAFT_518722 [Xylariomycetidae sp. FL0641]|nr:hypothetical protein F4780DRAFT_518722 [Xylariomycetidae sp. FL0641]
MAEAQEQPVARPQPEPDSAAAEEPVHAHPAHSPSTSLSRASQERGEPPELRGQEEAHTQVRTELQAEAKPQAHASAPSPPEAGANASSPPASAYIRPPPNTQAPDAAQGITEAAAREQEQQQEPELAPEQNQEHQVPQTDTTQASPSPPTSTPVPPIPSPTAVSTNTHLADPLVTATAPATTPAISANVNGESHPQEAQEQETAAPSSPAMSNHPSHQPGPPRQAVNYANPAAYAPPGLNAAHYAYPNATNTGHDPFRGSPNATNNAMALPSMRTFDPVQQQSQQHKHMAMAMPVTQVPSVPGQQPLPGHQPLAGQQPMPFYGQQVPMGGLPGNAYNALPPEIAGARYAIPPSGGGGGGLTSARHKKEIKRRTKTGCLTCRKRRIKCDEQHPHCKNCQKSKRECLGYDPIFKTQQQHASNIQPAPNHHTSSASPSPGDPQSATASTASAATSYTHVPPVSSNTAPGTTLYDPALAAAANPQAAIKNEALEYPVIDPALNNVLSTPSMSTSHFPAINSAIPHAVDHRAPDPPHLRGGGPSHVSSFTSASHSPSQSLSTPSPYHPRTPAYSGYPAQKMKVHELVGMGGATPPTLDSPLSQERLDEVKDLYEQVYAPGLEKFFEAEWYTRLQGVNALVSSTAINEMLAGFLQSMAKTDTNDIASMQYSANLEFRVVWDLATLVFTSEYKINVGDRLPDPGDASEARNRVAVFEALLSGEFMDQNPLLPPSESADQATYTRMREFKFWYLLAEFLCIKDQPNMDMTGRRDQVLAQLREVLDGRENRDVLYSLAVIRALAPNYPSDFESTLPPHLDESDPKSKLAVARKFIQDEAQVTGGTTNVVRRFSELAVRAFIVPGNNISRR